MTKGPAPAWVVPVTVDLKATHPPGKTSQGVYSLLSDEQTQLARQGKSVYRHSALRAIEQQGVEAVAHVSFDFDPTYESARLNMLRVHRAGAVQDRLGGATIKLLQRETELEARIYDGSQTADIALDDVRAGDVVEYAYTLEGSNPVLGANEYGRFTMQRSYPMESVFRRILAPSTTHLAWRTHDGALPPDVKRNGDQTDYTWAARNVAGFPVPGDTPGWWTPFARVEWGTYSDWAGVARWAERLYVTQGITNADLRREVERIAREAPGARERISAVLDFVQSNIRYLGIEIGPGSFAPRAPDAVFQRRFGDCKDKVMLSVAMLHALGVEAHPALVSTYLRSAVDEHLATPGVFNHVVFVARADGEEWWLDPTRLPQKAALDLVGQASFGKALVLDGKSVSFTAIPATRASAQRKLVAIRIDASKGLGSPAPIDVVTRYEGRSAERMRETLRSSDLDKLQLDYQNWYARDYVGLTRVAAMTVTDDLSLNRVTTHEHYELPSLIRRDSRDREVVWLYARDARSLLAAPSESVRSAPLAINHPEDARVVLTILMPDDRPINAKAQKVSDPAFEFSASQSQTGREWKLEYTFRTLADHVKPAELAAHIAHLQTARDQVGYTLRPNVSGIGADAGAIGLTQLLWFLAVAAQTGAVIVLVAKASAWVLRRVKLTWLDAFVHAFNCIMFTTLLLWMLSGVSLSKWTILAAVLGVCTLLGASQFRARAKSAEGAQLGVGMSVLLSAVTIALSVAILVLGNSHTYQQSTFSSARWDERKLTKALAEKAHMESVSKQKLAGTDRPLRGISMPLPELPAESQRPENTGAVEVEFFIESDGSVRVVGIVGTAHPLLAEISKQTVQRWKFEPPAGRGKPVRPLVLQQFAFLVD